MDQDGDTLGDLIETRVAVIDVDLSRTDTLTHEGPDATLLHSTVTEISADGRTISANIRNVILRARAADLRLAA